MMYKLFKFSWDTEPSQIVRDNGNGSTTSIPFDPDNTDYQQYLAWLAEGNTPLPADQGEQQ